MSNHGMCARGGSRDGVDSLRLCTAKIEQSLTAKRHPLRGGRASSAGRLPAMGRLNAETLHHGPPPAYARGRAAVGGAEPWPQVHHGILRGARAAAGL